MKRFSFLAAGAALLSGCVATPTAVPPGMFTSEAGLTVNLDNDWSMWAASINPYTKGQFLTKDGPLLNRLHIVKLEDGEPFVKAYKDTDLPKFSANASEIEMVDFVTASLKKLGYTEMDATNIRPESVDGVDGLRFDLAGKWENGLNVKGDAIVAKSENALNLVLFLAPQMHYYEESAKEVETIMNSIDL